MNIRRILTGSEDLLKGLEMIWRRLVSILPSFINGKSFIFLPVSQSDAPNGLMPSKVKEALVDGSVFASIVPKEFGGREINQKDLLQVAECLGGLDLSTFTSFNHIMNASNFINQFGTQEQKQRYLPGIAVGKWRPTICWQEDTFDLNSLFRIGNVFRTGFEPTAQVFDAHGQGQRLNAVKANVEGAMEANLFIVFANQKIGDLVSRRKGTKSEDVCVNPDRSFQAAISSRGTQKILPSRPRTRSGSADS
jgi:hypothetical protein